MIQKGIRATRILLCRVKHMVLPIGGRNPLHTENKKHLVWYRDAKRNLKVVDAPFSTRKARARALSSEPGTAVTGGARPEKRQPIAESRLNKRLENAEGSWEKENEKPLKIEGIVGSCDEQGEK